MFVLLEGEFQWRGELAGETVVLAVKSGEITGTLPFSRMKQYGLTGRAMTEAGSCDFRLRGFPSWCRECRSWRRGSSG